MRILFVNQFYWPDTSATAQMLTDLCEFLAAAGHDVHVVCARSYYSTTGDRKPLPSFQRHKGVQIHRVAATRFGRRSVLHQLSDFLSFHVLAGLRILAGVAWFDRIVTLTTPPLIGLYAWPTRLFGGRHVHWVMDLHPDCEFELGLLDRRQWMPRLLDFLNTRAMRHADRCVVLGECMKRRLLAKNVPANRIAVIPVWGHALPPADAQAVQRLREQFGVGGKFVVMYSGNAGLIHTFDDLCEAALRLRTEPDFAFLFIGAGRRIIEIHKYAARHGLTNILFVDYLPRKQLSESLRLPDVHFVCLKPEVVGISVPSKLYGIMAAARPAVFVGPTACESADAIRHFDCGVALPAGAVDELVQALLRLRDHPAAAHAMGERGRQGYESVYNPAACCGRWQQLIETV